MKQEAIKHEQDLKLERLKALHSQQQYDDTLNAKQIEMEKQVMENKVKLEKELQAAVDLKIKKIKANRN